MCHTYFKSAAIATAGLLGLAATAQSAKAAFVITIQPDGLGNVVATGIGSFNLTALKYSSGLGGTADGGAGVNPKNTFLDMGLLSGSTPETYCTNATGPSSLGTGGYTIPTSGSGASLSLNSGGVMYLPYPYTSGTLVSDTDTYAGATISSLGLTPGSYVWSWGTGPTADTATVNVLTTAVPEPASLSLLGFGALGLLRRRARRVVGI